MKVCPFCAEEIQDAAIKCRYCGSELTGTRSDPPRAKPAGDAALPRVEKEKVYFSDGAITVTSTRAVLGDKTYAMANVTSVSIGENNSGAGCGALLGLLGFVLAITIFSADSPIVGIVGVIMLVIGIALMRSKSFVVRIGSASGEANALENSNRGYIESIVKAVNQAIIDRR